MIYAIFLVKGYRAPWALDSGKDDIQQPPNM